MSLLGSIHRPRPASDEAAAAVRWSRAAVVAAWLVPAAVYVAVGVVSYRAGVVEAGERLERAARIGQEHAARVLETNEVIGRALLQDAGEATDEPLRARAAAMHARLVGLVRELSQVQSVWLWDAHGQPLASSRFATPPAGLGVADREYFTMARDTPGGGWFVSRPLISRSTGEPFIDFTLRRSRADGRFAGVVSVSLYPSYFARFYEDLTRREPGLSVALVRGDGWILARWPEPPALDARLADDSPLLAQMRAGISAGASTGLSSIDGVERLVAFRRVNDLPVWVAATLPRDVVRGAWLRRMGWLAAFTLPLAAWLAFSSSVAARRAVREQRALERVRREADQRIRAEQALRQSQKLEALGRITGGVAHDFNNLLMVINNNLVLLRRTVDRPSAAPQLDAIRRAVAAGTKLTRQLLAFARRQPLQPATVRLPETMAEIADLVRTVVGSRVEVVLDVAADVDAVEIDREEFELAVLNLAVNARDAMPDGGTVRLRAARDAPGSVAVSLEDSGTGIAPDVVDRVFEPFFTTKPVGAGTGLGLAQVYGFATQSGGTVRIASTPGHGTVVTMVLPEACADSPRTVTDLSEAPSLEARILLVEDNPDIAATTCRLLEAAGATVDWAHDGEQALQRVLETPRHWDAVLSDVMMPGTVDGLRLARALRDRAPDVPVVLMTGHAPQLNDALSAGFDVLAKPCAPDDLVRALARAIRRRRAPA